MSKMIVDLFAGGGLFSWGFTHPTRGGSPWKLALAVDRDEAAVEALRANFSGASIAMADVRDTNPHVWRKSLGIKRGELGLLHASPPCTDFSPVNSARAQQDDLFRSIYPWVREFQPLSLCFENVPAFQKANGGEFHRELLKELQELGYSVKHFVLDAASYGVPQYRRRLFYLGFSARLGATPSIPEQVKMAESDFISCKDAIGDLPSREPGDAHDWLVIESENASAYAERMRGRKFGTNGHACRSLAETQLLRLRNIGPGQAWESLPKDLQPKQGFRHCYGRLHPDRPAFTITTGVGAPSRGCFSHYAEDRTLTFREAARLQSISDDYLLVGTRSQRARIIGNAVPPLLAEAIRLEVERVICP
jgi:DNA (cytosine-5)-methyltransferase 1